MGNLTVQRRNEAEQFIFNTYLVPFLSLAMGNVDIFTVSSLDFMGHLLRVYQGLLGRKPTSLETVSFLKSPQMHAVPFIDVYSSLRAGMVLWFQDRRPKGSDLEDLLIAAMVLPYSDVFATDRYVKDLAQRLKLDKQYNVSVFGGRKADVLALKALARTLRNTPPPLSPSPAPAA